MALAFAIPDHPWVDAGDGAAVRIAMTVGVPGPAAGTLATVADETATDGDHYDVTLTARHGTINADLTLGADVASAVSLTANSDLSNRGFCLFGAGFIVIPEEAAALGLGRIPGLERHIRPYRNGKDITATPRQVMVIDLFGLTAEQVRDRFPEVYQWVVERVKPERDQNNREIRRRNWWVFGEPNPKLRDMLAGLPRYIATVETSKHRFFLFLDQEILPDNMLVNIASGDAFILGVLSSRQHVAWALKAGGRLGVGNDPRYNKTRCFETFPFPDASPEQRARIAEMAERLDTHRKARQALHPGLTLTDLYNVLEKLRTIDAASPSRQRPAPATGTASAYSAEAVPVACSEGSGESGRPGAGSGVRNPSGGVGAAPPHLLPALTAKERQIHEQGLVTVLRDLHDEQDAAVAEAYGWPVNLSDDEILARLVALNAERAAEEERGVIRWLRPEYQKAKAGIREQSLGLDLPVPAKSAKSAKPAAKLPWPTRTSERIQAVRAILADSATPMTAKQIAAHFARANLADINEMLAALAVLGHLRQIEIDVFAPRENV